MAKDVDLFRAAMADVTPLRGHRPRKVAAEKARTVGSSRSLERPVPVAAAPAAKKPGDRLSFDRDIDRALGRGRRAPEATLDLHGMTVAAAERAVTRFLERAAHEDLRVVLIVTGKGWREQDGRVFEGRIRREFPSWLSRADNRARIRGLKPAHPRHGGSGAYYVLLRRKARDSA